MILTTITKTCKECWLERILTYFRKDSKWKFWVWTKCKSCTKKYNTNYYSENKDWIDDINKIYYENNKERLNYLNKLNKRKLYKTEEWREKMLLRNQKYRALKKSTDDWTINFSSTREVLDKQGWVCNYCLVDIMERSARHLDHIYPLSKWWVHSIYNIQWLCPHCNLTKSDKMDYNYNEDDTK